MNYKTKISHYDGNEALAFSDVYLKPSYSDIRSRFGQQIKTSTKVALGAPNLNIPIISAGMDTVTEDKMAMVLALNGGMGEIHRNNTPDIQATLVKRVKEKMRVIEQDPPKVSEKATIRDALDLLRVRRRGYVVVMKGNKRNGKLVGIATDKDFLAGSPGTRITRVMTPLVTDNGKKMITTGRGISLTRAYQLMVKKRIEKLPVIDDRGYLIGVYTIKDYNQFKEYPFAATDDQGRLVVGAAIGVHAIDVERALKVIEAGADILFLDIAHGHSIYAKEMIKRLKIREKIKTPVVVGNVATKEGVKFSYDIGADSVKVGIGPGFVCETRNVAGTGIPQITAVLEAKETLANKKNAPPIISDGGVREPGDLPKAIACGADCVMIGTVFSGTDASPGDLMKIGGILQKRVRGMASRGVLEDRKKISESTTNFFEYTPEGRETFTPYQGSTQEILKEYVGGLRSAMSYAGSHNIRELQQAKLVRISAHGSKEQTRSF